MTLQVSTLASPTLRITDLRGRIGRSPLSVPGEPKARTHVTRTKPEEAPGAAAGDGRADRGGVGDPTADRRDRQHAGDGAGQPLAAGDRKSTRLHSSH